MKDMIDIPKIKKARSYNIDNHKDVIDTFKDCEQTNICNTVGYYVERIAYLENLVKKYKFDHLTGLMMKADFEDKFNRVFEEYQFADLEFNFAIVDIDGLHNVNRIQGYYVGDRFIKDVADQLRQNFEFNQIYRISGDEFVVLARCTAMDFKTFKTKLDTVENVTYVATSSTGYTNPKHMFKSIDTKLTHKKSKQKTKSRV